MNEHARIAIDVVCLPRGANAMSMNFYTAPSRNRAIAIP
ncbi:hypothetical protein ABIB10_000370 [Bradyrhizobium sp. RT3b]